jgi:hypothetical protein
MDMRVENWNNAQESHESRRARFERLGRSRMMRALNSIRLIGNLATPNYKWLDSDIVAMERAIKEQCDKTFPKFKRAPKIKDGVDFSFVTRQ